jgi:hypothetical protein
VCGGGGGGGGKVGQKGGGVSEVLALEQSTTGGVYFTVYTLLEARYCRSSCWASAVEHMPTLLQCTLTCHAGLAG